MRTRWTTADVERLANNPPAKPTPQQRTQALGRMKAGKMNKTEAMYAAHLERLKTIGEVAWWAFEPVNLRLGEKCFYSVDFLVMQKDGGLEAHEVKGHWAEDALVKIKVAAEKFPFPFIAVKLVKGEWEYRKF